MGLIEILWGLENTHYLLHDHRAEVEDIMDKLHAVNLEAAKALAASPADVIISYENTSSTLHSADQFRDYILPYLNEYADVAHEAGKVYLIHQCGKLRAFVDDMATARFDGNIDISPGPTGDLPLDEAAALMPGKVVAGGVDPTTFISRDTEAVRDEISGLIRRIKPYPGVLLGSADTTPWGARLENFHLMRELIDTEGSYI
jgi:uroporphyrinogen-III decarboxylase